MKTRIHDPFTTKIISPFISENIEFAQQIINWEKTKKEITKWVCQNRVILGQPWSYEAAGPRVSLGNFDKPMPKMPRPYLGHFVRNQSPIKSVIKCRQSEFTENHINEGLYYCQTRPFTKIAHLFPSDELGDSISNEKIAPAIEESPNIYKNLKGPGAVRRYAFKNGSMYTVSGVLKKAGGRAASRDMLIYDEVDSMPESIFGIFQALLSHSALGFVRYISTATVPNIGIDALVKEGSGFEWWIKCPKCKRLQLYHFPDSIINFFEVTEHSVEDPSYQKRLNQVYIGCQFCKAYIDRSSNFYIKNSKWIARKPHLQGIHDSYSVIAAMIPWKTGKSLVFRYHELSNYVWQFMNEEWGVAYLKSDQALSEMELQQCLCNWSLIKARVSILRHVSVGVDFGEHQSWVVVCADGVETTQPGKKCAIYIEEINGETLQRHGYKNDSTEHVRRVKQICDIFSAEIIIADAGGLGVDRVTFLTRWFPKRAWGCFFDTAEEGRQIRQSRYLDPQWTPAQHRVTVSKVNEWKNIIGEVRRGMVGFPTLVNDSGIVQIFLKHMQALGVQPRWSTQYEREYEIVVRLNKMDHLACAYLYATVGWNKLVGYRAQHTAGVVLKKSKHRGVSGSRPIGV